MTQESFLQQISRLRTRFGDRAFDEEFTKLVWLEAGEMSEIGFKRAVDVFIGSRSPNNPPLLAEFREARLTEIRNTLRTDMRTVARVLGYETRKTVGEILGPLFEAETAIGALKAAIRRRNRSEDGPGDCNL